MSGGSSGGLAEGEVVVRLEGATICNSDVHTLTGRRKVTSLTSPRVTCQLPRAGADPRGARSRGLRRGGGQRAAGGVRRLPRDLLRDGRVRGVRAVPRRAPAEVPRRHEGETFLPQ